MAFVVSGFLQYSIEGELTPIPSYGDENSMMVVNGIYNEEIDVESIYWEEVDVDRLDEGVDIETKFTLDSTQWRTPTFSWIRPDLPRNIPVIVRRDIIYLNPSGDKPGVEIEEEQIKTIVRYKNTTSNNYDYIYVRLTFQTQVIDFSTTHHKRSLTV